VVSPVIPPARSRRNAGAAPVWLPIGFRGRSLPGSGGGADAMNNSINEFTVWQAPSWGSVIAIKLVYPGFDFTNCGIIDKGVTGTVSASLWQPTQGTFSWTVGSAGAASGATSIPLALGAATPCNIVTAGMMVSNGASTTGIPAGTCVTGVAPVYNTSTGNLTSLNVLINQPTTAALTSTSNLTFAGLCTQATWGQARTFALFPRRDFYVSDSIPCCLATGSFFGVRTYASFTATAGSAGTLGLADCPSAAARLAIGSYTEWSTRSTGLADATMAPIGQGANNGAGFALPPVMILGLVADTAPHGAVVVVGDSIAHGFGDTTPDSGGRFGYIQRALANNVPWVGFTRGSTTALQMNYDTRPIQRLVELSSATDVILEYCRNDIFSGISPSNVVVYLQNIAAPLLGAGCRVWICTSPPWTSSTDSWATTGNQTIMNTGYEANRKTYNANVAANWQSLGFSGLIDVAGVVEYGGRNSSGLWRADGGAWTADGVHPTSLGHNALISAGVVPVSSFVPL
jgi:lysophospholipase L1-like esterase